MAGRRLRCLLVVHGFILAGCLLLAYSAAQSDDIATLLIWSTAQWIPVRSLATSLQKVAWEQWGQYEYDEEAPMLEMPVLHVQKHKDPLMVLEVTYGRDWRRRPLLLKGLWNASELASPERRLTLPGLLQENVTIPYFTDARIPSALTPDAKAPIGDIVRNISQGAPHKIGTQFLVQTYPELIREVAPGDILTRLFGDYFDPENVVGSGPFGLLPAVTTVPLFVARSTTTTSSYSERSCGSMNECSADFPSSERHDQSQPRTDLHCEPIGNVAVQLQGEKQWTLVAPEYSYRIRPSASPDGRAFFASWATDLMHVPRYSVVTTSGDAMWVPTWTWHRVDYIGNNNDDEVSIGGSLFHFRPWDFVQNHPLFAFLVIPNLVKELVGFNTQ